MRSFLLAVAGVVLVLVGVVVWKAVQPAMPSFVVRYRLSLEIDTPQGPRRGSGVLEMAVFLSSGKALLSEASGDRIETKGEAVFVDLGDGRNAVALLTGGAKGAWADWHRYFLLGVFNASGKTRIRLPDLAHASGVVEIDETTRLDGTPVMPTIVTFTDLADPASAKVIHGTDYRRQCADPTKQLPNCRQEDVPVRIDEIAATFGPGFAFRRATVEIVPKDTPITRGIEKRLVWMGKASFDDMRGADGARLTLERRQHLATIFAGLKRDF